MKEIDFHKSSEKGKGLPFAIVSSREKFFKAEDLFRPSLRDFHVIFWFKKGTGKYYIDFKEYEFKTNTIVMVSKDQFHYLEPPAGDWEIQSITFISDFIYRNDNDLQHLFHFDISRHIRGQQILRLEKQDADYLRNISGFMNTVYYEWKGQRRCFLLLVVSLPYLL